MTKQGAVAKARASPGASHQRRATSSWPVMNPPDLPPPGATVPADRPVSSVVLAGGTGSRGENVALPSTDSRVGWADLQRIDYRAGRPAPEGQATASPADRECRRFDEQLINEPPCQYPA